MQQESKEERSLGDLFADLSKQSSVLVRQEIALAKTELSAKVPQIGKSIGLLVVGGAVIYAGFLAIGAALIILLAQIGLPWWLSALLVGLVVAGAGYALLQRGRNALKETDLMPRQTIETLKEDAQWVKDQTS